MHFPIRHWPLSRQAVPSAMGGDLGHSLDAPVQRDSCSQVAYWASRHLIPGPMKAQFWQQGEFLSLQTAPWPLRSLQFLSQHWSLSSVPNKPASHSSSPSTRKFPQNDSSGSEKQRPDFACKTFLMARRLQGENRCKFKNYKRPNKELVETKFYEPYCLHHIHWRYRCTSNMNHPDLRWDCIPTLVNEKKVLLFQNIFIKCSINLAKKLRKWVTSTNFHLFS